LLHRLSGRVGNRKTTGQHLFGRETVLGDSVSGMTFRVRHHMVHFVGHHHTQCHAESGLAFLGVSFAQNTLQGLTHTVAFDFAEVQELTVARIGHRQRSAFIG
jgi:hypothetical protein